MQTELYSLSKIFTENLFRIPDYQRGYSWGERQLKDFWSDIALLDPNRDHYTGVLTLEDVPTKVIETWSDELWIISSKRYRPYYVVDGQQRLTTSLILLQCILERANGEDLNYSSADEVRKKYIFESRDKGVSRSYIFGYEKDNPSHEFLKTKIFEEPSDVHGTGEQTIYTHNLAHAKAFFLEPKNSSLGNLPFHQKRDGDLVTGGYRMGSYSEIEVAEEADWTAAAILKRGLRMLEFMEARWSINLGTRVQRIASLKLSFLEGGPQPEDEEDGDGDATDGS
jgi:hypothetical protein